MLFLLKNRSIMTASASMAGKIATMNKVKIFEPAIIESAPKKNPMRLLPDVPRKIFAGGLLKNKNPKSAPPEIREKTAGGICFIGNKTLKTKIIKKAINPVPAAMPSMPSKKLKILMKKISKKKGVKKPKKSLK